jgi:hypothetical protein
MANGAVLTRDANEQQQQLNRMLSSSWTGCVRVPDGEASGQMPGAYKTRVVCRQ